MSKEYTYFVTYSSLDRKRIAFLYRFNNKSKETELFVFGANLWQRSFLQVDGDWPPETMQKMYISEEKAAMVIMSESFSILEQQNNESK